MTPSAPRHIGYLAPLFVAEDHPGLGAYITLIAEQAGIDLKQFRVGDGYRLEVRLVRVDGGSAAQPATAPVQPDLGGPAIAAGLRAGFAEDFEPAIRYVTGHEPVTLNIEFKVPASGMLTTKFWEDFMAGVRSRGGDPGIVAKKKRPGE